MSIFTLERRNEVQEKLLEVGVELIKEKGIQKMTISEVTARAGIGKGTFYHFYSAKEYFVYDVLQYSKEELKKILNENAAKNEGMGRETVEQILALYAFNGDRNIVNSISAEDEKWLNERLPKEYVLNVPKEEQIISALLSNVKGIKGNPNIYVIANMMKIMAIAVENRNMLHENVLDENLRLMRKLLCDYIFGNNETDNEENDI